MSELDALADAGYTDAARERIGLYAKYLRRGDPMPTEHFLRLCDWLDAIAAGAEPTEVLGLAKGRGPAPSAERLDHLNSVSQTIWALHRGLISGDPKKYPLRDKRDGEDAFTIAAKEHDVSVATARLAWAVWGKSWLELERVWAQGPPNLRALKQSPRKKR